MLLQQLRNFQWMNEPEGVFFIDEGMKVVAETATDFFQNERKKINKDNGHLFHVEKNDNFSLIIKWSLRDKPKSAQSGIMVRIDSKNWANCFSIYSKEDEYKICSSLTTLGYSDCCFQDLNSDILDIWYKIERHGDYYSIFFSTNGEDFHLFRNFTFVDSSNLVKVGAFICSPDIDAFEAVLSYIELT